MPKTISPDIHDDKTPTGRLTKKAARQWTERAPVPAGKRERAQSSPRQVRPRTPEEIANEQTAEQLALRIWAAMVGEKALTGISALMDELLQSHLLDDDDEEGDEGWLDDHHKREKKFLDEAIADGLDKYPDINAIKNLPTIPGIALTGIGILIGLYLPSLAAQFVVPEKFGSAP